MALLLRLFPSPLSRCTVYSFSETAGQFWTWSQLWGLRSSDRAEGGRSRACVGANCDSEMQDAPVFPLAPAPLSLFSSLPPLSQFHSPFPPFLIPPSLPVSSLFLPQRLSTKASSSWPLAPPGWVWPGMEMPAGAWKEEQRGSHCLFPSLRLWHRPTECCPTKIPPSWLFASGLEATLSLFFFPSRPRADRYSVFLCKHVVNCFSDHPTPTPNPTVPSISCKILTGTLSMG